jgi:UDPglucose--hexose-1-phosphate uridylyltransferase
VLAFRERGEPDTPGWQVRVVTNKYPAVEPDAPSGIQIRGVYRAVGAAGVHEVVIEGPEHHTSLSELPAEKVELVFRAFRDRLLALRKDERIQYVSIYKNRGVEAGASLSHGHSQLIALPVVPGRVLQEMERSRKHWEETGRCLQCDILAQEVQEGARVVLEDEDFLAFAPFASRFSHELRLLPRRHEAFFERSEGRELRSLAGLLREMLRRIEGVLDGPGYNLVLDSTAFRTVDTEPHHWRLDLFPILSGVGGFERGTGTYINPTFPEEAARALRDAGVVGSV